jgi:sulfate permease, SulP family
VILAMLQFLRRMSASVDVQLQTEEEVNAELTRRGGLALPPDVLVYVIEGPFFFAAVENLERALGQTHTDPSVMIIRLKRVPFIDITGLQTLEEVIAGLRRRGVRVLLCEANERVKTKLERAGIARMLGPDNYADDLSTAIERVKSTAVSRMAKSVQ